MNRRYLLPLALVLIAATAGCAGFGSGSVDRERLNQPPAAEYAWDADSDVHITVQENAKFRGVYRLDGRSIELYRNDGFGGRTPLSVEALRYRYPNGTVVNASQLEARGGTIEQTREVVRVTLPEGAPAGGRLAFTAESTPKRFSLPTFVDGSYTVVLPEDRKIEFPIFGTVQPRGYDTGETTDGRVAIHWDDVSADSIVVQFYLQRDLLIFGAVTAGLVVVGAGGVIYYRRKIARLRRQREEMGLDVESDDDEFDRGPPPGMQ